MRERAKSNLKKKEKKRDEGVEWRRPWGTGGAGGSGVGAWGFEK